MIIKKFFIFLCILTSSTQLIAECIKNFDARKDYFPNKTTLEFSKRFKVSYHKSYKKVSIINPWAESKTIYSYILLKCGAPLPKKENGIIIRIPNKRVISFSTTSLPAFDSLHVIDRVIGFSEFSYVSNLKLLERIQQKKVVEIGSTLDMNIENIISLKPDIVFSFGINNSSKDKFKTFRRYGINVVFHAEFLEETPLARAEWIKFFALFFEKEKVANSLFQKLKKEYQLLQKLLSKTKNRPTVLVGTVFSGVWYVPGGNSYLANLIYDAGAVLFTNNNSKVSIQMDFESVFKNGKNADYWINSGPYRSIETLLKSNVRYKFFDALKTKKIYNNTKKTNRNGGNDYWESGLAKPNLILKDLIKIFHPEKLPDHQFIYYEQLLGEGNSIKKFSP